MKPSKISVLVRLTMLAVALMSFGALRLSAQKIAPDKSKFVYISDFELDAQNVQPDEGPTGRSGVLHGNGPVRRATGDPAQQAKHIVNLMSDSLVADFHKAGYTAKRLAPGEIPAGSATSQK